MAKANEEYQKYQIQNFSPVEEESLLTIKGIENQDLIGEREYLQLSMQISQNIHTIMELRSDLNEVEDQMAEVMDRLSNVVTRSELSEVMNEFGEPHMKRGYLVLNGSPFKADVVFWKIQTEKSMIP